MLHAFKSPNRAGKIHVLFATFVEIAEVSLYLFCNLRRRITNPHLLPLCLFF